MKQYIVIIYSYPFLATNAAQRDEINSMKSDIEEFELQLREQAGYIFLK